MGTEVSRYILRCPGGTIWAIHTGTVIFNFSNGRTRMHNVFNKHKSKIDQIILKYTNKVILSYLLGILFVLWYVEMSWDNLLAIHTQIKHTQYLLMVIFDFMTHSMKINLI